MLLKEHAPPEQPFWVPAASQGRAAEVSGLAPGLRLVAGVRCMGRLTQAPAGSARETASWQQKYPTLCQLLLRPQAALSVYAGVSWVRSPQDWLKGSLDQLERNHVMGQSVRTCFAVHLASNAWRMHGETHRRQESAQDTFAEHGADRRARGVNSTASRE